MYDVVLSVLDSSLSVSSVPLLLLLVLLLLLCVPVAVRFLKAYQSQSTSSNIGLHMSHITFHIPHSTWILSY